MRSGPFLPKVIWTAAAFAALASAACGQATFEPLGYLPGGLNFSAAMGVSADGMAVVGQSQPGNAFEWTRQTLVMRDLGRLPGAWGSLARACSADGSVVVGEGPSLVGVRSFHWSDPQGMIDLGSFGLGYDTAAQSVSADGTVVVGYAGTSGGFRAFRWTAATGLVNLGTIPGGSGSFAFDISADGEVVVGQAWIGSPVVPVRWTAATGFQSLPLPAGAGGTAYGVSGDGRVVVGRMGTGFGQIRAFRWTAATGTQDLGVLAGESEGEAYAASFDGTVVVGNCNGPNGTVPFVWHAVHGMAPAGSLLGPALPEGWRLTYVQDVSSDESVIVGSARDPDGRTEAFRATLPPWPAPCYANCDGSTIAPVLNVNDFVCFQTRFAAGDPVANCDGSTAVPVLNINDLVCFQTRYAAGCG